MVETRSGVRGRAGSEYGTTRRRRAAVAVMTSRSSRAYAGAEDLRRMQRTLSEAFTTTYLRVGDLAWMARHRTHRELALDIRLWEDGRGELIGWTFFRANGGFNLFVLPGEVDEGLIHEMVDVIDEIARVSAAAGDPPLSLHTYGLDPARCVADRAVAACLEQHGFTVVRSSEAILTRELAELPAAVIPTGYRLGSVRTPAQVFGRVQAQQAAFAPSNLTVESYERVRRTWPYRPDLDRIALTNEGLVAAFCTAWLDEHNAAGLLEPVGTDPAHRHRGLAKAVCLDALRVLRDAGMRTAQVGFKTDAAAATYRSIGFQSHGGELVLRRDAGHHP